MSIRVKVLALGLAFVGLTVASSFAQQTSDANAPSLADIARQQKKQKAKDAKPVKVFTNDNLSAPKNDTSPANAKSPEKKLGDSAAKGTEATSGAHDAAYFRSRMSDLQTQLDTHKRELDVLQQKLSQNQVQYYADPNQALQQQYSREDINKM